MAEHERTALHRRLGRAMIDAFDGCVEKQRIELPPEFRISDDAVLWAPMIYGPEEHSYGAELGGTGLAPSGRATAEFQAYWRRMPDFHLAAYGGPHADETGFSLWFRFEGTTEGGRTVGFYEADFMQANDQGEISRIETFHDVKGLTELFEALGMERPLEWQTMRKLRSQSLPGSSGR